MAYGLVVLAALLGQVPPGPVGPAVTVAPAVEPDYFQNESTAYGDATDRYVSVYAVENTFALRSVTLDAATGALGSPTTLAATGFHPSIAWNPSVQRFLAVYTPAIIGGHATGLILDSAGLPVGGPTPFTISTDQTAGADWSWNLQVTSDGSGWLVAWELQTATNVDVRCRSIDGASINSAPVFASAPLTVATTGAGGTEFNYAPVVAFGAGSDYLVTWTREYLSGAIRIYGRTVSPTGVFGVEQNYHEIVSAGAYPYSRVIANPATGEFLVAWNLTVQPPSGPLDQDPAIQRVSASGAAIGTVIDIDPSTARSVFEGSVSLVYNSPASQVLAFWMDPTGTPTLRGVRLNAQDLSVIQSPFVVSAGPIYSSYRLSSAARTSDSQVLVQWTGAPPSIPTPLMAQRYNLGTNPGAPVPAAPGQFRQGGLAAIAPGDSTNQPGFLARAQLTDPQGDAVRLQVEVRELGLSTPVAAAATGSAVGSGSVAEVWVTLARNKSYHWRLRGIDSGNTPSDWMVFVTGDINTADIEVLDNTAPSGSLPAQLRPDGTAIPPGGKVAGSVRFQASTIDTDGDPCRMEVEVRPIDEPLVGTPTSTGAWMSGALVHVDVALPEEAYHWQWAVRDDGLDGTTPLAYGLNPAGDPDFHVLAVGSMNDATACVGAAGRRRPGGLALLAALAALGLLLEVRLGAP